MYKLGAFGQSICFIFMLFIIAGCSSDSVETEARYPSGLDRTTTDGDIYGEKQSLLGDGGFVFGRRDDDSNDGSTGIGVNSFLWRASLDTVSFMPLASADPFGGVIITDWYTAPEKPNERFKINVFILDKQLRSDGISVKIFRQEMRGGRWADSIVADDTSVQLEDAILTRARQLRVAQLQEE
ncbi:MAG: DUF3576 domain-containing protein [Pseudomonadota bacterium]